MACMSIGFFGLKDAWWNLPNDPLDEVITLDFSKYWGEVFADKKLRISTILCAGKTAHASISAGMLPPEVQDRIRRAIERDVRPVIHRMELAAYDVLFNKVDWQNSSTKRRNVFSPPAQWDANSSKLTIKQGSTPTLEWQILDQFGAYPKDLSTIINELPKDWWSK